MALEVRRNDQRSRYELVRDGEPVGIAEFRSDRGRLVFPHTEILSALRGQGLGAVLVKGALDDVRALGKTIVPTCWFVAEFIDDNPEYRDLLADSTSQARQ